MGVEALKTRRDIILAMGGWMESRILARRDKLGALHFLFAASMCVIDGRLRVLVSWIGSRCSSCRSRGRCV